ncbi:MAG: hypothetical protein ACRDUS_14730 [Mycobacterium sp.]
MINVYRVIPLVVAVAVLAACENGDQGVDTHSEGAGSSAHTATATPAKVAKDLVLTPAELPGGLTVTESGDEMTRAIVDQLTGQGPEGVSYAPEECRPVSMFNTSARIDASKTGMILGQDNKEYINAAVVTERPDIGNLSRYFSECGSVRLTDPHMSMETTYAVLENPQTRADELVMVNEHSAGDVLKEQAYLAYARVGEYAVWVRVRALRDVVADRAMFDQLVTASINKVANAT